MVKLLVLLLLTVGGVAWMIRRSHHLSGSACGGASRQQRDGLRPADRWWECSSCRCGVVEFEGKPSSRA